MPAALNASCPVNINLWHRRMGHLNLDSVHRLKRGLVSGVHFGDSVMDARCSTCAKGKQTRLPFNKESSRASEILEVVHSDVCGPMEVNSLGGSRYFLMFTDDKSRRVTIYFLKEKSADNIYEAFEDYRCSSERQTGKKIENIANRQRERISK